MMGDGLTLDAAKDLAWGKVSVTYMEEGFGKVYFLI